MKRLLTATTALALVGGAAFAEISVSGDAKFSLDYNSEPGANKSKHEFKHEMGVDFTGSGTTDGGLSFGGKAGFDTGDDTVNTGNAWISGAFGKITVGDNDPADFLAGGIADVGVNGIGVDDTAEFTRGNTASQFRYDHSFGNIALAVSAGTNTAEKVGMGYKKNDYAIGMSFSMSGATLGLGYDNYKATSLGLGYATGPISVNALYSNIKESKQTYTATIGGADGAVGTGDDDVMVSAKSPKLTSIGADMSYSIGASTLTLAYGKTTIGAVSVLADNSGDGTDDVRLNFASGNFSGAGMGFTHDLGGGAKLVAGFGKVDMTGSPTVTVGAAGTADGDVTPYPVSYTFAGSNKASIGLTFAF